MIDRKNELSVKQQCDLLGLPHSTFYYKAAEVSEADLELMRRIDELHNTDRSKGLARGKRAEF